MTDRDRHINRMNTAADRKAFIWLFLVYTCALLWSLLLARHSFMPALFILSLIVTALGIIYTSLIIYRLDNERNNKRSI